MPSPSSISPSPKTTSRHHHNHTQPSTSSPSPRSRPQSAVASASLSPHHHNHHSSTSSSPRNRPASSSSLSPSRNRPPHQLPLIFSSSQNAGHKFSKSPLDSHASAYLQDRPGDCRARAPGAGNYFSSPKASSYNVPNVFIMSTSTTNNNNNTIHQSSSSVTRNKNNANDAGSNSNKFYKYTSPTASYALNHPENVVSGGGDARNTKEPISKYKSKWLGGVSSEGLSQVAATRLSRLTRREQRLLFDTNEEFIQYCQMLKQHREIMNQKDADEFLLLSMLNDDQHQHQQQSLASSSFHHADQTQNTNMNATCVMTKQEEVRRQYHADELFCKTVGRFIDEGKKRTEVEMTNRRRKHKYLEF